MYFPRGFDAELAVELGGLIQQAYAQFQAFEKGKESPTLPQLELLALYFNLPVEHFWGRQALSQAPTPETFQEKDRLLLLRNRAIGTNLRLARATAPRPCAARARPCAPRRRP